MSQNGQLEEVITHGAIEPVEREWDDLARGALPFLQPGWISAWWDAFGEGELTILTVRRGGRLVGVLPLARRGSALCSTTNWHTPMFGAVTADRPAGKALARALYDQSARRVRLGFLAADAPLLQDLKETAPDCGYHVAERVMLRPPYVPVSGSWEQYWSGRSRNLRKSINRLGNRLEDLGTVSLQIAAGDEALGKPLEEAFTIEASGWKGTNGTAILSQPETRGFYREVASWAAQRGTLRIASLQVDGRTVAMHLSIEAGGDYYMLKTGYDAEFEKVGPGKLLDWMMVQHAFSSDLDSFEFLGDAEPYKLTWADEHHERVELQAFKRSPSGQFDRLIQVRGRSLARRALAFARR